MPGRPWEPWEDEQLRKWYGQEPISDLAKLFGRSIGAVHQRAGKIGAAGKNTPRETVEEYLLRLHPLGYSDGEIQETLRKDGFRADRHRIGQLRKKHGLSNNRFSERTRRRVAEKTKEQCRAAGVETLAELKSQVMADFAVRHGWPKGLTVREAQICELLWRMGPMSRRAIAEALGMKHEGPSRWLLKTGNGIHSSLTATLIQKGLVIRLRKGDRITGKGKGRSRDLYALKPGIQPSGEEHAQAVRCGSAHGADERDSVDAAAADGRGLRRDRRERYSGDREVAG